MLRMKWKCRRVWRDFKRHKSSEMHTNSQHFLRLCAPLHVPPHRYTHIFQHAQRFPSEPPLGVWEIFWRWRLRLVDSLVKLGEHVSNSVTQDALWALVTLLNKSTNQVVSLIRNRTLKYVICVSASYTKALPRTQRRISCLYSHFIYYNTWYQPSLLILKELLSEENKVWS